MDSRIPLNTQDWLHMRRQWRQDAESISSAAVCLQVSGDRLQPGKITEKLGLQPDKWRSPGGPSSTPHRPIAGPPSFNAFWSWDSGWWRQETGFVDWLKQILAIFEQRQRALAALIDDRDIVVDITLDIFQNEHGNPVKLDLPGHLFGQLGGFANFVEIRFFGTEGIPVGTPEVD